MRHRYTASLFKMLELDVIAGLRYPIPAISFQALDNRSAIHVYLYTLASRVKQ